MAVLPGKQPVKDVTPQSLELPESPESSESPESPESLFIKDA